MANLIRQKNMLFPAVCMIRERLGLPTMFCHGDLKVSNMLFKRLSDGTPGSEVLAVLDWQVTFYGEPFPRCSQ